MSGLVAVAVVTGLAVLACLAALLLVVAPFVLTVDLAERRGLSPLRAGVVAASGLGLAALVALLLLRAGVTPLALVLPAVIAWAAPLALSLTGPGLPLGGRSGAHE